MLAATLVIGVLWVTVKHPYEGRVIYELSERHGIHRYDVVGFIPALIALVWWLGTPVD
ncbi:MAG: hypothetical protein JWN99_1830 [Ilumatobacteraceae bacterium]|nr:hypothetical protein [Ilumatobacteraceae bacterium]